jgi:hypothetical protein
MNTMTDTKNLAKQQAAGGKIRMTPSEAFVETLVAQGVKDTFGIVGSAYMDAHDLFPLAGIRFISVAHEQNAAHMAALRRTVPASPTSSPASQPRTGRIRRSSRSRRSRAA